MKTAELHDASPEAISGSKRNFDSYWNQQREVMVDRCRLLGFPKLFVTIAPTEWKYPMHSSLHHAYKDAKRINDIQGPLTLHYHHTLLAILDDILRKSTQFELLDYSLRVEFQARGTLHVHLCAWVEPTLPGSML